MCKPISFISNGRGNFTFFTIEDRLKLAKANPKNWRFDSHASIADAHLCNEDKVNKYEWNFVEQKLVVDQINTKHVDSDKVLRQFAKKHLNPLVRDIINKSDDKTVVSMFKHFVTKRQALEIAIFSAKLVLPIFESKYPKDKSPRKALKAAHAVFKHNTKKNRAAAYAAAYAADAAYAAAAAAYAAAYAAADAAAYAAAYAADAAYAAYAAAADAYAAADVADAAADAVRAKIANKIRKVFNRKR